MRFEISYRAGSPHVVELSGSVAVLGRDPGCDVVLNDGKCSRRHATVEDLPEGLVVRDAGSANGTYVNGKRIEKARLRPGDTIRLGDARLTLLADVGETLVVAPEDLELDTTTEAPLPPRPPEAAASPRAAASSPRADTPPSSAQLDAASPRAAAGSTAAARRPATVALLAALWALSVPLSTVASLVTARRVGGSPLAWGLAVLASLTLAGLGTAMALGLRDLAPWARRLQVVIAGLGLLACPFTLASATVLLYLNRPEVKAAFEGRGHPLREANGTAEATFALSFLAMLLLGLGLAAIAALIL
jgi:hypothetical protein